MPKPKEGKSKVTFFPPQIKISPRSSKYDLYIDISWGSYSRQLKISKEYGQLVDKTIAEIDEALCEAVESAHPYILHD